MKRTFPVQQLQAAAEAALEQCGYRPPYQYVDETQVLVGEERGNFVSCLQYQLHTPKHKVHYVVVLVDADPQTGELTARLLWKRANVIFSSSEVQFSLYR